MTDLVSMTIRGAIAVLAMDSQPVNALGADLRRAILTKMQAAFADPSVDAIVLSGGGSLFSAGADIGEFGREPQEPDLADLCALIEDAVKPVVAAIHGAALGGGLELALAAHFRIAGPTAKLGLPEVQLGILPGAGGTQRLPRLVSPEEALGLITTGRQIDAEAAKAIGLVDVVAQGDLLLAAEDFARRIVSDGRPLPRTRDRTTRLAEGTPELFTRFRAAHARKFRGREAPEACIKAVEAAVSLPFAEGMSYERRLFHELVAGAQSAALRYSFFAERQAAKIPDIQADMPARPIERIGVIGAGTMGTGIAMSFLSAGIPVTIVETTGEGLQRGVGAIRRSYEKTAERGGLAAEEVENRVRLLTGSLDMAALRDCDLIIEAAFEDLELKKEIFRKLDAIASPRAILASNTSYLDIDDIAASTGRPEAVVGMHFFSPAHVMRLIEVVRGARSDRSVIASVLKVARRIGKVPVTVGVCHGFVGNRMLEQRQREANQLILDGAMPWDVDRVLCEFGMPMGPFAMSDLAGLDVGWSLATSRGETISDRLCELGRRGQKTRAGFYDYDANRRASPSPVTEHIILDCSAQMKIARRPISDTEILERCLLPIINEGAKILEEGKALRASDIDVIWINGYGWPAHRGGPLYDADQLGLGTVLDRLTVLQSQFGDRFKPASLLVELVRRGGHFGDGSGSNPRATASSQSG